MGPASANAAWTTSGKRLNINQDEPEPPLENGLDRPKCFDDGPAWTAGHKPAPNSLIGAGPLRRGRSASIPRRRRPLQSLPASPVQPAAFARWFVAGWIIREEFGELVVHDLEVRHILQVHIALEHIVSRCSPSFNTESDVVQGLDRLRANIPHPDDVTAPSQSDLPGGEDVAPSPRTRRIG